jgi:CheY-like chemotaxis protein
MTKRILMLDDELPLDLDNPGKPTPYMWYYANAMRKAFGDNVVFASTLDSAKLLFQERSFDVVSLDVILPSNDLDKTRGNTRTGLEFFSWLATTGKPVSVIILTLLNEKTLREDLPKERGGIGEVVIQEKIRTRPDDFVKQVELL